MRIQLFWSVILTLSFAAFPSFSLAQGDTPPGHSGSVMELLRYEPTGLSLVSPYARGKIPVIFIHGLWSNPASWHRLIATLEREHAIREKYQFWTFGYSTGDPIPYSAYLLRRNLDDVRAKLDPDRSDTALDQMVVVGHSMGGLLSKMLATDAGDRLWRVVSDRPFGELAGAKDDRELFKSGLFFGRGRRFAKSSTSPRRTGVAISIEGRFNTSAPDWFASPTHCGQPTTGWCRATNRHSSVTISARPFRPASMS